MIWEPPAMSRVDNPQRAENNRLQAETRRHFFGRCGVGLGTMALANLLEKQGLAASPSTIRPGHFPARARSVIYLFMAGGPSQLELFDYKPELIKYSGQP